MIRLWNLLLCRLFGHRMGESQPYAWVDVDGLENVQRQWLASRSSVAQCRRCGFSAWDIELTWNPLIEPPE